MLEDLTKLSLPIVASVPLASADHEGLTQMIAQVALIIISFFLGRRRK